MIKIVTTMIVIIMITTIIIPITINTAYNKRNAESKCISKTKEYDQISD